MKFCTKKRGLSLVIASIFMILLVVVLAALIFLWARGFISEQIEKFGQPIDNLCKRVDFQVALISSGAYNLLEIVNRGDINISGLEIKMYSEGNSEIIRVNINIPAGKSASSEVFLGVMQNGKAPDKIGIFPILTGNIRGKNTNKVFTCYKNQIFLTY